MISWTNGKRQKGITLLEMLCVLVVVGLIARALTVNIVASRQQVDMLKISSYLLQIQAIQTRHWLLTGMYLPLSELPALKLEGVSVIQNNLSSGHYKITVNILWLSKGNSCKARTLSELGISPQSC